MGSKPLRKIQLGRETTAGTAVAATALYRGLGVPHDQRTFEFVEEDIGIIAPTLRNYESKRLGAFEWGEVPATFEQLGYLFEAGIKNTTTGTADGTGSGYVYTYAFGKTSKNTVSTFTLEGGDDQQAEEMAYCFVSDISMSGKGGEAVNVNGTWMGNAPVNASFTGAIAVPTVESILFSSGALYVDTAGGTWGGTQISDTLLSMSLSLSSGINPIWLIDSGVDFATIEAGRPELSLELTYLHNSDAVAELAAFRAGTPRLVQLLFQGSDLETGDSYDYNSLILNVAGQYQEISPLEDEDGNDLRTMTLKCGYDETAADFAEFIIVNEDTSLP